MRRVGGISAVLLMCLALSSCSGNRPDEAFMGTWKKPFEEGTLELSFMDKGVWTLKPTGSPVPMNSGTWTIDPDGNASMDSPHGELVAMLMKDGRMAVRADGAVHILEKADKQQ